MIYLQISKCLIDRDIVIGVFTTVQAKPLGVRKPVGATDVIFYIPVQPPVNGYRRPFQDVKRPESGVNYPPPCRTNCQYSYTSIVPVSFRSMLWGHFYI